MVDYILNKVDMEIREIVNQSTEEHIVHPKGEIQSVKKYGGDKKKKQNNDKDDKEIVIPKSKLKNSKIVVTAVKSNKIVVDAELDKTGQKGEAVQKGNYLDIRR